MRSYLDIDLGKQTVESRELHGEEIVRSGRYLIAKTLLEAGVATVDPLGADNPMIFSAGPFAGTNFSNANRLSVGCKSPLTGGIKEANTGGTMAFALGQLQIAGFTLHGVADEWVVIRIALGGEVTYDSAAPYMGKGNDEAAAMLFEHYGEKVAIALCGPVGEYLGLMSGISFTDPDGRPSRLAARGGVGAVMGSKRVKAIIVDRHKMPPFHDRKKVMMAVKEYGRLLGEQPAIKTLSDYGTANVAEVTNKIGGLPVRNFSSGQLVARDEGVLKMGGTFIHDQNKARGGETSHACMPGCQIKCSNVYVDKNGKEMVSPLEYETIGLLGTNCGLTEPDEVAGLNAVANDLGIDSIELGTTLGMMMDHGLAEFGDTDFMYQALEDIRVGNERGRLLAQGTARVGAHYGCKRIPVIKKQGISAYDPRVIEVTAITMMHTAQGADHTAGNLPSYNCDGKSTEELAAQSLQVQTNSAAADSLGLCVFGRTVTDVNYPMLIDALNAAHDAGLDEGFIRGMARETLRLERQFNKDAGFTAADDELPSFFVDTPLPPTNKTARHTVEDITRYLEEQLAGD